MREWIYELYGEEKMVLGQCKLEEERREHTQAEQLSRVTHVTRVSFLR